MLAKGIVAVTFSALVVGYAIYTDPLPGFLTALLTGVATSVFVQHRQSTGRWPTSWTEWERSGMEVSPGSSILQTLFAFVCLGVGLGAPNATARAIALALAGGACLAFAATGLSLIIKDRRTA